MKKIYLLTLCYCFGSLLTAQSIKVQLSSNRTIREEVSDDKAETIRRRMEDVMAEYQIKGALEGATTGRGTLLAANKFKDLFRPDAQHFVDFRDRPEVLELSITDYKNELMNVFGQKRFNFEIGNVIVQEITPVAESGDFLVDVVFTKKVMNQQKGREAVQSLSETDSRKFVLKMDVSFDQDLEAYSILGVSCTGNCTTVSAPTEIYLAGSAGWVQPFISGDPVPGTNVDFSEVRGHKLGASFMTNGLFGKYAEEKRLFISAGLGYHFWKETATANPESLSRFAEIVTLHMLQLPIGASYRVIGDQDKSLNMQLLAIPSISLSKTKRLNASSGAPELITGTGLWIQASPTYYQEVVRNEPAIGFQVSLDLGFNVLSPFGDTTGEDAFVAQDRTIVNSDVKIHYVGLRVGVNIHSVRSAN